MPEIELKLAALPQDLPRVREALLALGGSPASRALLASTYYDTEEGKLKESRLVLRVRRQRRHFVQTVKSEDETGAAAATRGEWEDAIADGLPDPRAANSGAHLPPGLAPGALRPQFTTIVRRTLIRIEPDAATEIEAALDRGEVRAASGDRSAPICEIELELKRGNPAALYDLALHLVEGLPLRPELRSKSERGYRLLADPLDQPDAVHARPLALAPEMSLEQVLQRVGRDSLALILRNERAALAGIPDGIHQLRVATRRLRSFLGAIKRSLPPAQYRWANQELKWLAGELGPVRNWAVLAGNIVGTVRSPLVPDRDLATLSAASERRRRAEQERAEAAIRSTRYVIAVLKLSRWLEARGWRDQPISEQGALLLAPIGEVAPRLIERANKKARRALAHFGALSPAERHRARIRLKKLRYVIELLAPVFAADAVRPFVRRLKLLQEDLGQANDIRVAGELLGDVAAQGDAREIARVGGVVLGWHDRGLADHEPELRKHVRRFRRAAPFW